jgi:hypothetical protein
METLLMIILNLFGSFLGHKPNGETVKISNRGDKNGPENLPVTNSLQILSLTIPGC